MTLTKLSRGKMLSLLAAIGLLNAAPGAFAQTFNAFACGDLRPPGQYGPYDYRTVRPSERLIVETTHFTPSVEQLRSGSTGSTAGADLDYTLRALPNSPRALLAVSRYATKMKAERAPGLRYTTECYFERAIRFVPDDPMPYLLYASYLKDRKRMAQASEQLDIAEKLRGDPSNFDFDYNLGLLFFEVGKYDRSAEAAKRAYALGAPLPALKNKLKAKGAWKE